MSANTASVATVTGLEMVLVLAWWSVLLSVPAVLIRSLRRRRAAVTRATSKRHEPEPSGIVGASEDDVVHVAPPLPQARRGGTGARVEFTHQSSGPASASASSSGQKA